MSKCLRLLTALLFILSLILPPNSNAQEISLPLPGIKLALTKAYSPMMVKGLLVHPNEPFKFDFLIDSGDSGLQGQDFKDESMRLIKYFLAALTIPENKTWVNLSPYEKSRIIPKDFAATAMGRDLLGQDYILKQLTASLTDPEKSMGKEFWDRVYSQVHSEEGMARISVNTFNKVWIIPQEARVYEHGNGAFVVSSHLKVMLEEDYLALGLSVKAPQGNHLNASPITHSLASQVIREVILPALEKEINEGSHFAQLRQIYNAMILATWYKIRLRQSILGQLYADRDKTKGIDLKDRNAEVRIYQRYLLAFKKGVYNLIKEDKDVSGQMIPRKYFSGGTDLDGTTRLVQASLGKVSSKEASAAMTVGGKLTLVAWQAGLTSGDKGQLEDFLIDTFIRLDRQLKEKEVKIWRRETLRRWFSRLEELLGNNTGENNGTDEETISLQREAAAIIKAQLDTKEIEDPRIFMPTDKNAAMASNEERQKVELGFIGKLSTIKVFALDHKIDLRKLIERAFAHGSKVLVEHNGPQGQEFEEVRDRDAQEIVLLHLDEVEALVLPTLQARSLLNAPPTHLILVLRQDAAMIDLMPQDVSTVIQILLPHMYSIYNVAFLQLLIDLREVPAFSAQEVYGYMGYSSHLDAPNIEAILSGLSSKLGILEKVGEHEWKWKAGVSPDVLRKTMKVFQDSARRIQSETDSSTPDPAQITDPLGGIDLNASQLNLQVKGEDKGMIAEASFQHLDRVQINGLYPIILNIQEVSDPLVLLAD